MNVGYGFTHRLLYMCTYISEADRIFAHDGIIFDIVPRCGIRISSDRAVNFNINGYPEAEVEISTNLLFPIQRIHTGSRKYEYGVLSSDGWRLRRDR